MTLQATSAHSDGALAVLEYKVPAAGCVYVPGQEPHTFSNPSAEPARMPVVTSPGGFEGFFRAVAAETAEGAMPDPTTMARLNAEHGVTVV